MTRHREDVHVYGSSLDFWREEKVAEVLSKSGDKLGAADYLDARSLANLMKEEDRFLEKIFTRVSDELQAMGAVTKQAFEKVATRFFGWDLQKERSIFIPPEILREEQRAKDLLSGNMRGEEVSYGHSSEKEQGRTPERKVFIDAGKVEEALKQNMASFADDIFSSLGEPLHKGSSSATQRRYGKNGHISVNLRTGAWINFKDSELSGGPLHMLTKLKGMEFKEAVEYGASWAGIGPERNLIKSVVLTPRVEGLHSVEKERSEQEEAEKRIRIEKAQALWEKGELIKGTLADRYLKEHRQIVKASSYDLRLLPGYKDPASGKNCPCLMAAARSFSREITAVQLIYLDPETGKKADIPVQKKSFGVLKGSFVTLQEGTTDKPIFVAEGIETALSIKEAGVPGTVMASLGLSNLKHLASASWSVDIPKNSKGDISPEKVPQRIIICADHDDPDSVAAKSLEKSAHFLQEKGHLVTIIKPEKLHDDFNDVLKARGEKAVKSYIQEALKAISEVQRPLNQESEKICKPHGLREHINKVETKRDSLGENSQDDIQALYRRFKEVRAEMARHLHPPLALIDERNTLGYTISQDKEFMAALKTEDKKAFYLIEDCASKHIFYKQHENEGLSL
jgi:phage/plasmid primase-like uncharacterized protein